MKKIISIILLTALILSLAGCAEPTASESPTENEVSQISMQMAEEIAIDFVGYGELYDIRAFTAEDALTFEVELQHESMRYVVLINAENGNIIEMSRHEQDVQLDPTEEESDTQLTEQSGNNQSGNNQSGNNQSGNNQGGNNQSGNNQGGNNQGGNNQGNNNQGGGQSDTGISLERAIEIGHEELARRGYTGTFRESCRGFSRGQQVWELLFRVEGGRKPLVEMYINMDTGAIVKFEWDD